MDKFIVFSFWRSWVLSAIFVEFSFVDNEFEFKNIPIIEDYYFEIESEDNIKNVSEDEIDNTKKDVDTRIILKNFQSQRLLYL